MAKVLFTMDALNLGGTETSLLEIATRFQRLEPVFCCFYEHRHLLERYRNAGLRVHFLGSTDSYGFRRAGKFLSDVLAKEQPDIVVGHLLRSELVTRTVCRMKRMVVVGTFVNDTYSPAAYATKSREQTFKTNALRLLNRISARWCFHFIANSDAIARSNCDALAVPRSRVSVVPRGRDEKVFYPATPAREGPIRTIANVARLLERKGLLELVEAFARIASDFPDVKLRLAGEGGLRGALEGEIARQGLSDRVELVGNIENVSEFLREADLFVFPSHYEGFSGALVEAMLTGLPIIASDIPMNLEAVDAETAYLFPSRDIGALEDRLRQCIDNPALARQKGQAAQVKALVRFNLMRVSRDYEALLLELIERGARQ